MYVLTLHIQCLLYSVTKRLSIVTFLYTCICKNHIIPDEDDVPYWNQSNLSLYVPGYISFSINLASISNYFIIVIYNRIANLSLQVLEGGGMGECGSVIECGKF